MYSQYQKGPQGVQNDRASGSKVANRTDFDPFYSATEKIYSKYHQRIKNRVYPFVRIEPTKADFIFPVTVEEIKETLERIPEKYLKGIKAVLVPTGTKKQVKVLNSLFCYGEYWRECVFLHPYPRAMLSMKYTSQLKPSDLIEYRRAGAEISEIGSGTEIRFNEESLTRFYLCDVLMHEVGHHNDQLKRTKRKREGFANWFATEYGYRLKN